MSLLPTTTNHRTRRDGGADDIPRDEGHGGQISRVTVSLAGNVEWEQPLVDYVGSLKVTETSDGPCGIRPEDAVFEETTANLRVKVVIIGLWGEVDLPTRKTIIDRVEFFVLVGSE